MVSRGLGVLRRYLGIRETVEAWRLGGMMNVVGVVGVDVVVEVEVVGDGGVCGECILV